MKPEEFGKIMSKIRYDANLTLQEFGKNYNATYQAASRWERGTNLPDEDTIYKICQDYGLDYEYIKNPEKRLREKRLNKIFILTSIIIVVAITILTSFIK